MGPAQLMGLHIMESARAFSVRLASGVEFTIDNLLGASLPIAMSGAHSMFVLQAQNWVIQIEDVLSLNYTHLWVNMGFEGLNCALLWV